MEAKVGGRPRHDYTSQPLVPPQCQVCKSRSGLLRCGGCQVAYYCGRDHQTAHRDSHKHACVATKKARTRLTKEEILLRNIQGDGFTTPLDVFEDHVGHFWGILETRDYMRARHGYVDTLVSHFPRHRVAVQTALDHMMDMLRLCRSDNMGVRDMVPALMLRLGRDQDAYDFVKWWATCDPKGTYDWGDISLPYLDTKEANMFETPIWWTGAFDSLSHSSTVLLIKLRLLLKLRELQNATRAFQASTLPREIVDDIRKKILEGSALAGRQDLATTDADALSVLIEDLMDQIWDLYLAVDHKNMHFCDVIAFMQSAKNFKNLQMPDCFTRGSPEEVQIIMLYSLAAWEESPGALDELHSIHDLRVQGMFKDVLGNRGGF